jgi:hypothetical protein
MISVRLSATAKDAPRLMAVVVFPTPPFWFAMAMIRDIWTNQGLEEEHHGAVRRPIYPGSLPGETQFPLTFDPHLGEI